MKRIILHIGHRKVGSTSIQNVFATNPAMLAAAGIYYPRGGRRKTRPAHHNLAYQYLSTIRPSRFVPEHGGWEEVLSEIDAQPLPCAVVSSEAFTSYVSADLDNLLKHFKGREVRAILYLRRHDLWLRSQHNQLAKFGRRSLDPDAYLAAEMAKDALFMPIISLWRSALPDLEIRLVASTDNVVMDFAERCGVNTSTLDGLAQRRNASAPLKFIVASARLGDECRGALGEAFTLSRRTAFKLSEFFRPRPDWLPRYSLFSVDHARSIDSRYREEREKIAALTNQQLEPLMEADYVGYVADPFAFKFDDEEAAFLTRMRREIVRHSR